MKKKNKELKELRKNERNEKNILHNFKTCVKKNRISKFIEYLRNFYSRTST